MVTWESRQWVANLSGKLSPNFHRQKLQVLPVGTPNRAGPQMKLQEEPLVFFPKIPTSLNSTRLSSRASLLPPWWVCSHLGFQLAVSTCGISHQSTSFQGVPTPFQRALGSFRLHAPSSILDRQSRREDDPREKTRQEN